MRALHLGLSVAVSCVVLAACAAKEPEIQADPAIPAPAPTPERKEREHYLGMAVPEHELVPWPNVNGECEPGQVRACRSQIFAGPVGGPGTLWMHCARAFDGSLHFDGSECATPLVVAFDDAPVEFLQPMGSAASFTRRAVRADRVGVGADAMARARS